MNKAELIEHVQNTLGKETSKAFSERCVNSVLDGITEGLKNDDNVQLIGFGTFNVKERKARQGRNPQTGEQITIKASRSVGFKAGQKLKNQVN